MSGNIQRSAFTILPSSSLMGPFQSLSHNANGGKHKHETSIQRSQGEPFKRNDIGSDKDDYNIEEAQVIPAAEEEDRQDDDDDELKQDEEYQHLITVYESASNKLSKDPTNSTALLKVVNSLITIGDHHWINTGNLDKCEEAYQNALTHLLQHHEPQSKEGVPMESPEMAILLHKMGSVHARKKSNTEAMKWYNRSIQIKTKVFGQNSVEVVKTLNGIAMIDAENGDIHAALRVFNQANSILHQFAPLDDDDDCDNDHDSDDEEDDEEGKHTTKQQLPMEHYYPYLIVVNRNLAQLYQRNGDYDGALKQYRELSKIHTKALPFFSTQNDIIDVHVNIADCLFNLTKNDEAQDEYESILQTIHRHQQSHEEEEEDQDLRAVQSVIHHNLGLIYGSKNQYDNALEQYKLSLNLKRELVGENHFQVAETCNCMGAIYGSKGDKPKALNYFEEALRIYRLHSSSGDIDPNVRNALMNVYIVQGK